MLTPVQVCALRSQRMLEVDGVPWSALVALVQASYQHAQRNPDAVAYGRPLDHQTYAGSRWVSEPLRLYDCSRENDGAAAVLVTSAQRARELRSVPAFVLSGVQGAGPGWSESAENNAAYTSAGFHPAMVARLWAQAGIKANPEIGTQLFLSDRTVEWHLRKVYTKLGITSRRELNAALAQPAPTGSGGSPA